MAEYYQFGIFPKIGNNQRYLIRPNIGYFEIGSLFKMAVLANYRVLCSNPYCGVMYTSEYMVWKPQECWNVELLNEGHIKASNIAFQADYRNSVSVRRFFDWTRNIDLKYSRRTRNWIHRTPLALRRVNTSWSINCFTTLLESASWTSIFGIRRTISRLRCCILQLCHQS